MKFQFEGYEYADDKDYIEIDFDFMGKSEFIRALEPDLMVPVIIPERFEKYKIDEFKKILEKMTRKEELTDGERHLCKSEVIIPLLKYFKMDNELINEMDFPKPNEKFWVDKILIGNGLSRVHINYSDDLMEKYFKFDMPQFGKSWDDNEVDDNEVDDNEVDINGDVIHIEISFIDFIEGLRNKENIKFSWWNEYEGKGWSFSSTNDGILKIKASLWDDNVGKIFDFSCYSFSMTNEILKEMEKLIIKTDELDYVFGRGLAY